MPIVFGPEGPLTLSTRPEDVKKAIKRKYGSTSKPPPSPGEPGFVGPPKETEFAGPPKPEPKINTVGQLKHDILRKLMVARLERNRINPTQDYYTDETRTSWKHGIDIRSQIYDPYIESLESSYKDIRNIPSSYKVVETSSGYDIIPPQPKEVNVLAWGEKQYGSQQAVSVAGEKQHMPFLGALYGFGLGILSHTYSLAKPSIKYLSYTGPQLYGYGVPVVSPRQSYQMYKALEPVHFPTLWDIALEPVGLAPKGTTKLIGKYGPGFWAGGVAFELAAGKAISKAASPFVKPIGKGFGLIGRRITGSSYFTRLSSNLSNVYSRFSPRWFYQPVKRFVELSPKRFGLRGALVRPYVAGAPSISKSIGMGLARFGEKTGLLRYIQYGKSVIYKPQFFGSEKIWVHAGSKYYQNLLKTMVKTGGSIVYNPITRNLMITSSRYSFKPFGMLFKKFQVSKDVFLGKYNYPDELLWIAGQPSKTGFKPGISATGEFLKHPPVYSGLSTRSVVSPSFYVGGAGNIPQGLSRYESQLLQFIEKTKVPFETVSGFMPEHMLKGFPKIMYAPPAPINITGPIVTGLFGVTGIGGTSFWMAMQSKKMIEYRSDLFFSSKFKQRLIQGLGFNVKPVVKTSLDISSMVSGKVSLVQIVQPVQKIREVSNVQTMNILKTQSQLIEKMVKPSIIPAIPLPEIYGKGKKYPYWELWGRYYRKREFKLPSFLQLLGIKRR